MRLKQIKLAGFKSFVDPTTVPFPAQMTAIVGPNGCGKSNIIDAVRWVLGESSAKNLRGDAMTDVIFNGSSARKPVSQGSIELVFDNSEGRLQGEFNQFNEIAVKRVVTRDAVSTYLLNGSKCRKKDITELFLGTGLGPRSYAIIEQGMISRLIESKPQELRLFIEEAAGISKYKERRRETENRIRHTRDNLARLDDVRAELQQQLEKLKRQSVAAIRYKELKSKERRYKAQYAALRWLRLNNQTEKLDKDIKTQQLALEQLLGQQQGDESEMHTFKTKQAELKHKLEQTNQALFKVAQAITKAEQNLYHLKERRQGIDKEQAHLKDEKNNLSARLSLASEELADMTFVFEESLPEKEMLEEDVEQAILMLSEQEESYQDAIAQWQNQSEQYYQLDNDIKANEAKVNSLNQLMTRTTLRMKQLNDELTQIQQQDTVDLVELTEQITAQIDLIDNADKDKAQLQSGLNELEIQQQQWQLAFNQQSNSHQQRQGQIASLKTLIDKQRLQDDTVINQWLQQQKMTSQGHLFDLIKVNSPWELAVETVLAEYKNALYVKNSPNYFNQQTIAQLTQPLQLLANDVNFFDATCLHPQSLAHQVTAPDVVKALLANVLIDTDVAELTEIQSVIDTKGYWRSPLFQFLPGTEVDSLLLWRNELQQLQNHQAELENELALASEQLTQQAAAITKQKHLIEKQQQQLQQLQNELMQWQNKQQLAQSQAAQWLVRKNQITDEIHTHQSSLTAEDAEQTQLLSQITAKQEQQRELKAAQQNAEQNKQTNSSLLTQYRQTLDQKKTQLHQLVLSIENNKNQIANKEHALRQSKARFADIEQRQAQLQSELTDIDFPIEESTIALHENFTIKTDQETVRSMISAELVEVDQCIVDLEQDQHGIFTRAEKMREQLAALKIEREGYHVRANSVLEVLKELDQNLKAVLHDLPIEADEASWQQALEKTSAALSRLGAINLAAIEEYEQQSDRKAYLDAQNNDLVAALDTLEDAIRKIDRETKAKFKETYDSINAGLQHLFPKVFGGGAAYLDLTGEDLLDTGVTIMARPPGKRNSTIHLLSGGEKALTALSLVFSIFKLNPAPFCMLDEVDAPLDDANVGRFCRLVQEMSDTVQFVFISHNKIAMEMADHLVGVTMQEPGVSRMVAVDMEKAIELAQM